jgi:hypothetical protein
MDLRIKEQHVLVATPNNPCKCPTAVALKAVGIKNAEVGSYEIRFYDHEVGHGCVVAGCHVVGRIQMPKRLVGEIRRYDDGEGFETGIYRIPGLKKPKGGGR